MSLKDLAKQTLELIDAGAYVSNSGKTVDFSEAQAQACQKTVLFRPEDFPLDLLECHGKMSEARIRIIDSKSTPAAENMCRLHERVLLLNFASAKNPGGGFLNGAIAQEEDLCRCSGLYPALLTQPKYYEVNRRHQSLIYTDHAIYSPKVPFFKVAGKGELLDEPFLCSVLTAPAPNAAELRKHPERIDALREAFFKRWAMVLHVARVKGYKHLLLGAWGCGAFGNEAEDSAKAIKHCLGLERFADAFEQIVFAIPDKGKRSSKNLNVFRQILVS